MAAGCRARHSDPSGATHLMIHGTLHLLGYNMSVAVWVGLIALAGLDAETGVVMLLYLDHAWEKYVAMGRP